MSNKTNYFLLLQENSDDENEVNKLNKVNKMENKPDIVENHLEPASTVQITQQDNNLDNLVNNLNNLDINKTEQDTEKKEDNNKDNNKNNNETKVVKETKEEYNKRPTFTYKIGEKRFPIRAGGVLFYRKIDDDIELLLIHNEYRNCYEDFGGRTDEKDATIEDTIAREADEESNGLFKKEDIKIRMMFSKKSYSIQSKYMMYFVRVTSKESQFMKEDFGNKETHDGISRTIDWFSLKEVLEEDFIQKLNPRLNNNYMLKILRQL